MTTPALHVAGWHDIFLAGTLANFSGLRAHAATEQARDGQRLIVGPWTHAAFGDTLGERFLGRAAARASLDLSRLQLDFFAAVLRGESPPGAPVRLFTFGRDSWREEEAWPPAGMRIAAWELGPGGEADAARRCGLRHGRRERGRRRRPSRRARAARSAPPSPTRARPATSPSG